MHRRMAVLPHAAVQPGHGAGQERSCGSPRAMSQLVEDRSCGKAVFAAIAPSMRSPRRRSTCYRQEPGGWRPTRRWPLDRASLSLSRSAQPPAGRADPPLPLRCHGRARAAQHPPDHQRHRGRLAQYGLSLFQQETKAAFDHKRDGCKARSLPMVVPLASFARPHIRFLLK